MYVLRFLNLTYISYSIQLSNVKRIDNITQNINFRGMLYMGNFPMSNLKDGNLSHLFLN